jgi:hypothetical protein
MLCSLVDQAPNDVIEGAVEADPQQIHTGNPCPWFGTLINKQGKIQHCRESWKISGGKWLVNYLIRSC